MDVEIHDAIRRIHASPAKIVLVAAGGGIRSMTWLLTTPGASQTILEALIPYSDRALADFLGERPRRTVTIETAELMASRALERAKSLSDSQAALIGVACTAAIATDRPKRGKHRVHVSCKTEDSLVTYSLELVKGRRDRTEEDTATSLLVLRAITDAADVGPPAPLPLAPPERVQVTGTGDPITLLLAGAAESILIEADGSVHIDGRPRGAVLSGSFAPLHIAHRELAATASETLRQPVAFEMSIANVDKPPLSAACARQRLAQFAGRYDAVLTRAPTFSQKAEILPNTTFVIGYDTAKRLFDPRYYQHDERMMTDALTQIRRRGGGFLVAGRLDDGIFRTLDDIQMPNELQGMFQALPEGRFRQDISSTELRAASQETRGKTRWRSATSENSSTS